MFRDKKKEEKETKKKKNFQRTDIMSKKTKSSINRRFRAFSNLEKQRMEACGQEGAQGVGGGRGLQGARGRGVGVGPPSGSNQPS